MDTTKLLTTLLARAGQPAAHKGYYSYGPLRWHVAGGIARATGQAGEWYVAPRLPDDSRSHWPSRLWQVRLRPSGHGPSEVVYPLALTHHHPLPAFQDVLRLDADLARHQSASLSSTAQPEGVFRQWHELGGAASGYYQRHISLQDYDLIGRVWRLIDGKWAADVLLPNNTTYVFGTHYPRHHHAVTAVERGLELVASVLSAARDIQAAPDPPEPLPDLSAADMAEHAAEGGPTHV